MRDCGLRWGVPIRWLEYRGDGPLPAVAEVDHATAVRKGEPFEALIRRKRYLPNPVARFCTEKSKVATLKRVMRGALGWTRWTNVVGLRADEPGRALRAIDAERNPETAPTGRPKRIHWRNAVPLFDAGITGDDVAAFWRQPFDLGTAGPHQGNCDGCYLRSRGYIQRCMAADPEGMAWWARMEASVDGTFRNDREPYAAMAAAAEASSPARHSVFDDRTGCDNWACTD